MDRLDGRSHATASADFRDTTTLEGILFQRWFDNASRTSPVTPLEWSHHGCDNSGGFIAPGSGISTRGEDYRVRMQTPIGVVNWLVEFKFAPAAGKAVFKECNLRDYAANGGAILLVTPRSMNHPPLGYRACKEAGLTERERRRRILATPLEWGFIRPAKVSAMLKKEKMSRMPEMGDKMGARILGNAIRKYVDVFYPLDLS